jgi:hypothetical protein
MSMNWRLTEMAAQSRMSDMRRAAAARSYGARRPVTRSTSGNEPGPAGHPAAARRAIGWFLVSVGLRLAVPRQHSALVR